MTKQTFLRNVIAIAICLAATTAVHAQDVYVGGTADRRAATWKNGTLTYLSTNTSGDCAVNSVVVNNTDVYAAGNGMTSPPTMRNTGMVWKNGSVLYCPEGSTYKNSIAISGTNVYAAGSSSNNPSGQFKGVLWKNNVATFYDGSISLSSVFIDGSNVYVAGYEINATGKSVAKVWKNETILYTFDPGSNIYAIFVADGIVYSVGTEAISGQTVAKAWKNNASLYTLGTGATYSIAQGLYISNGDVYVAGYERNTAGKYVAKLWKNGTGTDLTNGSYHGYAHSVVVSNCDVYVAGGNDSKALLWKNGEPTTLASNGCGYSVFVKHIPCVSYVPVETITGVPAIATVGEPLLLSGMVEPSNATNQNIVWSVSPLNTLDGVTVTGATLYTTTAGTAKVRATISATTGTAKVRSTAIDDYTQDFDIVVNSPTGITRPTSNSTAVAGYYNLIGTKLLAPPTRGIYIIIYDNGKAEKVIK